MEDKKITMPAVALRGLTILPGMVQHFDISREKSVRAVETAMMGDQKVYLVTQRHPEQEVPTAADLYQVGTVSQIKQIVKMPGGNIRVMVEGEKRAALLTLFEEGTALIQQCGALLDSAEQKVVRLRKGENGEPEELPFDVEEQQ